MWLVPRTSSDSRAPVFLTALPWPAEDERLTPIRVVETAGEAADEILGEDVFAKEASLWASRTIDPRTRGNRGTRGSALGIGEVLQWRAQGGYDTHRVGQPVWARVSGLGRGGIAPRGLRERDL